MKKIYFLLVGLIFSMTVSAQCTELFFSEYAEGSSSNKYLELYNPSNSAIDLSSYSIFMINNGGTPNNIGFQLEGSLAANDVFIIAADAADATILALADTVRPYNSVAHFNGDDCILLIKGTDTIDQIGQRWVDPGSSWTVGTGSTANHTLVRKTSVDGPDTAWATTSVMGWDVYPSNTWTNLGSHNSTCSPLTEPATAAADPTHEAVDVISIYSQSYTNPASINYYPDWTQSTQYADFVIGSDSMIKYSSLNYQGIDFDASEIDASSMEMLHIDIWTADVDDIDIYPISRGGEKLVKKTLTAGQWNSIDIPLSEYTSQGLSMSDIWQFKFDNQSASNGTGTIFIDNMYFWKNPTLVYNVADIADIVGLDADFFPANFDTLYEVTGVVYGVDLQGGDDLSNDRLAFTIIDDTDGVGVFAGSSLGYQVNEGDEVTVKGPLGFFNGLTQIIADSITVVSTGNTLKDATEVTSLSEDTESDLVKFTKVWFVDNTITEWPSNNSELTNGTDTFAVRVDSDTKGIIGSPVFDTMNIQGLGGQFDNSAPYDEGYQLFPMDSTYITEWVLTSVKEFAVEARVYPNPAQNNLTVIGTEKWNTFEVYNIVGSKVSEGELNNNNLSVSDLVEGTYIIKLQAGNRAGVARFVINR